VCGLVLALVGVAIHFLGSGIIHTVQPPAVTGAVVMLIGFNLAPVVATIYWPQDQWVALLAVMTVGRGRRRTTTFTSRPRRTRLCSFQAAAGADNQRFDRPGVSKAG